MSIEAMKQALEALEPIQVVGAGLGVIVGIAGLVFWISIVNSWRK